MSDAQPKPGPEPKDLLSSVVRKHLRSLGRTLPVSVRIGARGLTSGAAAQVGAMLAQREMVKVRLPVGAADRREMADSLAVRTGASVVVVVGRTVLLYRPNPDVPAAERIELPQPGLLGG